MISRDEAERANGAPRRTERLFAGLRLPGEICFGAGQRRALGRISSNLGSSAFVCADPFMADSDDLRSMLTDLEECGVRTTVFTAVVPELPLECVTLAVDAAAQQRCDLVIAVGGGSSIDLAKLVSCLLVHGGQPSQYYGEFAVPGPILPVIAVPTTAGTGSEVTPVAVLTDSERNVKVGVSSPYLIPTVAICDPELTASCPPGVTAASGADALSHCIESYSATRREPNSALMGDRIFVGKGQLTDDLALAGIRSVVAGLHRAYAEPDDIEARELVMYGSLLGGLAFGTAGNAAAHALQYPLGAETKTPHGVGIGLLLPYVMDYNLSARVHEYAEIALIFGAERDSEMKLAEQAPRLVQTYLRQLGIPTTLAEIGFDSERIPWASHEGVRAKRLSENNPVELTVEGALSILVAASHGSLTLRDPLDGVTTA